MAGCRGLAETHQVRCQPRPDINCAWSWGGDSWLKQRKPGEPRGLAWCVDLFHPSDAPWKNRTHTFVLVFPVHAFLCPGCRWKCAAGGGDQCPLHGPAPPATCTTNSVPRDGRPCRDEGFLGGGFLGRTLRGGTLPTLPKLGVELFALMNYEEACRQPVDLSSSRDGNASGVV